MKIRALHTLIAAVFTLLSFSSMAQEYSTRSGKAVFRVNAPARMIEGSSQEVNIRIDSRTGAILLDVPIASFGFSNNFVSDTMNAVIRDRFNSYYMESNTYPGIAYRGLILDAGAVRYARDGRYPIHTKGTLNLHGEEQVLITDGEITVKGKHISVTAQAIIRPHDYSIRIPSYIGDLYFGAVTIDINASLTR